MLENTSYLLAPSSLIYLLIGFLFGVGTSVLSDIYPAWKPSEANPMEALRHEYPLPEVGLKRIIPYL